MLRLLPLAILVAGLCAACKSRGGGDGSQVESIENIKLLQPDLAICRDDKVYKIQKLGADSFRITRPDQTTVDVPESQILATVCPGDGNPPTTNARFCGCKDHQKPGQQWPSPKLMLFSLAGGQLDEKALTGFLPNDEDCQGALRQRQECRLTGGLPDDVCSCLPFKFPWMSGDYFRGKRIMYRDGRNYEIDLTGYHSDFESCDKILRTHPACAVPDPGGPGGPGIPPTPAGQHQLTAGLYLSVVGHEGLKDRCDMDITPVHAEGTGRLLKFSARARALESTCTTGDLLTYQFTCDQQSEPLVCSGKSQGGNWIQITEITPHTFTRTFDGKRSTFGNSSAPTERQGPPALRPGLYAAQGEGCAHKVQTHYAGARLSHIVIERTANPAGGTCTVLGRNVFACLSNEPGSEVCTSEHVDRRTIDNLYPNAYRYQTPDGNSRNYSFVQ